MLSISAPHQLNNIVSLRFFLGVGLCIVLDSMTTGNSSSSREEDDDADDEEKEENAVFGFGSSRSLSPTSSPQLLLLEVKDLSLSLEAQREVLSLEAQREVPLE